MLTHTAEALETCAVVSSNAINACSSIKARHTPAFVPIRLTLLPRVAVDTITTVCAANQQQEKAIYSTTAAAAAASRGFCQSQSVFLTFLPINLIDANTEYAWIAWAAEHDAIADTAAAADAINKTSE